MFNPFHKHKWYLLSWNYLKYLRHSDDRLMRVDTEFHLVCEGCGKQSYDKVESQLDGDDVEVYAGYNGWL